MEQNGIVKCSMTGLMPSPAPPLVVKRLGHCAYDLVWEAMREFTFSRDANTADQLWLVEHPAVFTQGLAGKAEHVLAAGNIPVVQTDRGGQVTYHGPGQVVAYTLIDLARRRLGIRDFVSALENVILDVLALFAILGERRPGAPGVYVNGRKIAALGLRVKNGRTYHGLSLNVNMDLEPFTRINPCGYSGMEMTQMSAFPASAAIRLDEAGQHIVAAFCTRLSYAFPNNVAPPAVTSRELD